MTPTPSDFSKRTIARLAERALRESDAIGELPTPLAEIQRNLGVAERIDISDLPEEVAARKPSAWSRILGAFWKEERVIFIDRAQVAARRHWTDGHEAAHAMCPWHAEVAMLDNEQTLSREAKAMIEAEANYGAAQLIFQGGRFHRRALENQISMRTPLSLCDVYGASGHATVHYYVEEHPFAVALLVAGRYPQADRSLPIWKSVESDLFAARHGRLIDRLPNSRLSLVDGPRGPFAEIIHDSSLSTDPPSTEVEIPDRDGAMRTFVAEAFFNQYCHFIFVADKRATRLGRRLRLAS